MKIVVFTQSLVSDWNHGNAHFLRGVLKELQRRGHDTIAYEPADSWSRTNLIAEQGVGPIIRFREQFPQLHWDTYEAGVDLDAALDGADLVIVHEWNEPWLVAAVGRLRLAGAPFSLLFHDTHHRAVSAVSDMAALDLGGYDGVLAFGEVLAERYRSLGWGRRVFTWHEAADTTLFRPSPATSQEADLVWIGNWGDGERARELETFLIDPVARLGLTANLYGVRYPKDALDQLAGAGITYRGWLANADVPDAFARHRVTVHVPRGPYAERLPGIPTIRVFEALACGIPLVSAPWSDIEGLFRPGEDFLIARSGEEMAQALREILSDQDLAASLRKSGAERIRSRHSCAHRVDELFDILARIGARSIGTSKENAA